ncbi:TlpA family protein disulfide reductase [Parapedobacter koreensis]|uniref:AhpC/TSA family protein n=1 Tax=Parapedobacter koreensis TaxID=332977 RepID=A0A1H7RBG3_9SPHI|nr:redoxin domain-containing protein [Parapedobacter koreensis]SEL57459.1 AhpC/TSA family protein [Parapedobacter koreensis]
MRSRYSAGNDLQRKINRAEAGNPNGQSPWGEAGLALPQIPPSLTLPSGSIRVCPAYTSVKVLTSGTLAKDRRLYSGIEAYKEGHGMGWGRLRKNLLCVQTLAQALALPGRGRANGVLLCLLFLFTQPGVHAQSMPRVSREDVNDSVEIKRIPRFMPEADLERFRLVKYHVQVDSAFRGIRIGDTIPDVLWDFPLWVVNDPEGKDTIRLREHQDTDLLVLDFWASWCSPCVESMHKWEGYTGQLGKRVKLIGVHIDYDYKALPFSRRRNWRVMSVIGADARMLNRYFFDRSTVSRLIWIKNGKLAAITGGSGYDLDTVRRFADGESVAIPIDTNWTYSSNAQSTANR